jgi:peptidoglycan/xylan/chitin deacetylase (PgdA/CDA1 family)
MASELAPLLAPVTSGCPAQRSVALTFDDGPDGQQTLNVLHVLAKENARATFFLSGCSIARNPSIARETVAAGHEAANHGYDHYPMTTVPPLMVWANVALCNGMIEAATGVRPRFFRPPHGACDETVLASAATCGLRTVLWNVMANDWQQESTVEAIVENISTATAGSIILCHDKGPHIAEALRQVIPFLKQKGLEPVTLSTLLQPD